MLGLATSLEEGKFDEAKCIALGPEIPKVVTECVSVLSTAVFAANLTVTVNNIEENRGKVHAVIYDASNWLDGDPDNFAGSHPSTSPNARTTVRW